MGPAQALRRLQPQLAQQADRVSSVRTRRPSGLGSGAHYGGQGAQGRGRPGELPRAGADLTPWLACRRCLRSRRPSAAGRWPRRPRRAPASRRVPRRREGGQLSPCRPVQAPCRSAGRQAKLQVSAQAVAAPEKAVTKVRGRAARTQGPGPCSRGPCAAVRLCGCCCWSSCSTAQSLLGKRAQTHRPRAGGRACQAGGGPPAPEHLQPQEALQGQGQERGAHRGPQGHWRDVPHHHRDGRQDPLLGGPVLRRHSPGAPPLPCAGQPQASPARRTCWQSGGQALCWCWVAATPAQVAGCQTWLPGSAACRVHM